MPLGIGNNLIRNGGGLNPDGLSLDLQFATDKTLTARKGPTPVLTRGTSATFVNSAGLIEYAPENLITNSNSFNNWAKNNCTVDTSSVVTPEGSANAWKIVEDSLMAAHYATIGFTPASGTTYTASVWLKSAENGFAFVGLTGGGFSTTFISVNLSTGAVSTAVGTPIGATSVSHSNGWWRVSFSLAATASLSSNVDIRTSLDGVWANRSYLGNGVNGMYVYGAQVEVGPLKSYNPTTTAAFYGPRFDHNPVSPFACRGLLIEEGRTNLISQSENHPSATWSKTGLTVASASNTDPAGAATSNLVSEDSSTGLHRLFQSTAYVSGTSYAISVFLKYAGRQFVAITHPAVAANNIAIFDIQNGTITLTQSGITTSITAYPNGWYRCVVTGTSSTTGGSSHIIQGSTTGGILTGSYTGLNGPAFYIYGSQVEAGSFPTSYIPTTTGTLARSADVCSITNTAPFWNSSEFTVFTNANFVTSGVDAYASNFSITAGFFGARRPNTNLATGIIRSSGVNADISFGTSGSFTTGSMRMALAHSTGQQAGSLNGATAIQQNSAFVPSSNPPLNIGYSGAGAYINGHVLAIRYYKKRLANAKLQALTA